MEVGRLFIKVRLWVALQVIASHGRDLLTKQTKVLLGPRRGGRDRPRAPHPKAAGVQYAYSEMNGLPSGPLLGTLSTPGPGSMSLIW